MQLCACGLLRKVGNSAQHRLLGPSSLEAAGPGQRSPALHLASHLGLFLPRKLGRGWTIGRDTQERLLMLSVMPRILTRGVPCAEPFNALFNLALPCEVAHCRDEEAKAQGNVETSPVRGRAGIGIQVPGNPRPRLLTATLPSCSLGLCLSLPISSRGIMTGQGGCFSIALSGLPLSPHPS